MSFVRVFYCLSLGKGLYRSIDTLTVATPLKKMSFLHQQQLKLPSIEVNRLVNRFFIRGGAL